MCWNIPSKRKLIFKIIYLLLNQIIFLLFFQLFVIICLILARTGFAEGTAHFLALVDTEWVTITSVCSYTFIYPMLIICYLMGEVVPIKLVSLKQFWYYHSFFYIFTRIKSLKSIISMKPTQLFNNVERWVVFGKSLINNSKFSVWIWKYSYR